MVEILPRSYISCTGDSRDSHGLEQWNAGSVFTRSHRKNQVTPIVSVSELQDSEGNLFTG